MSRPTQRLLHEEAHRLGLLKPNGFSDENLSVAQRIEAARVEAIYAPSGSDREQYAVSTWSKLIAILPEAAQREAAHVAIIGAAIYGHTGSDLARQAKQKLSELSEKHAPSHRIPAAQPFVSILRRFIHSRLFLKNRLEYRYYRVSLGLSVFLVCE